MGWLTKLRRFDTMEACIYNLESILSYGAIIS